ncbi:MAG: hypothetical protein ACKVU0_09020 [Saprospiraceae bacterium]
MNKFLLLILAQFIIPQGISAQCEPQFLNCNASVFACDLSQNASLYWNDLGWWDSVIQTHDLAESKIDLNLVLRDTCPGDSISVRCLLFLDLDDDNMQETVVDSDNPPTAGTVNFGNAFNPNYTGGTPRAFDQRPVPANLFWRFALRTAIVNDTATYALKWVNDAAPNIAELPELAYGSHKVRWIVTSSSGAVKTCEKSFLVKDCKAPTVVCLDGLSVNIMPTQMIQLWASDFLQYADDNVTPGGQIKIGIRKSGTGVGFPQDGNGNPVTSVIFNCDELGTQEVEIWAIDLAGNADYCETNVIVLDNFGFCGDPPAIIKACVRTACEEWLEEIFYEFTTNTIPPISYFEYADCGSFSQILPTDTEVTITPSKEDNPLNGVWTYDLIIIQKHIDGTDLFDTPYQWVAADANKDNVIDNFDILECRNLILGIYTQLPNNHSWRFIDKDYVFPSPDPLSAPIPETITVNTSNIPTTTPEFVGVKICDLTCGNLVGFYDLELETQHLIGNPEPNPTNDGAMLPLQLLGNERVLLEVMDVSGRLLFRNETPLPAGPALLEIPASAMPQSGVYVWRVRAGEIWKSGKIVRY